MMIGNTEVTFDLYKYNEDTLQLQRLTHKEFKEDYQAEDYANENNIALGEDPNDSDVLTIIRINGQ